MAEHKNKDNRGSLKEDPQMAELPPSGVVIYILSVEAWHPPELLRLRV